MCGCVVVWLCGWLQVQYTKAHRNKKTKMCVLCFFISEGLCIFAADSRPQEVALSAWSQQGAPNQAHETWAPGQADGGPQAGSPYAPSAGALIDRRERKVGLPIWHPTENRLRTGNSSGPDSGLDSSPSGLPGLPLLLACCFPIATPVAVLRAPTLSHPHYVSCDRVHLDSVVWVLPVDHLCGDAEGAEEL